MGNKRSLLIVFDLSLLELSSYATHLLFVGQSPVERSFAPDVSVHEKI